MSLFTSKNATAIDQRQSRLLQIAAVFLLFFSLALTLSPAARLHSWQVTYRWNHWIGFLAWILGTVVVHYHLIHYVPERDPYIFPIVSLLCGWGLLTIWRLDANFGVRQSIWLSGLLVSAFSRAADSWIASTAPQV